MAVGPYVHEYELEEIVNENPLWETIIRWTTIRHAAHVMKMIMNRTKAALLSQNGGRHVLVGVVNFVSWSLSGIEAYSCAINAVDSGALADILTRDPFGCISGYALTGKTEDMKKH